MDNDLELDHSQQVNSFGWAVVAVIVSSMTVTGLIVGELGDSRPSLALAALIVGITLSIPTRLTALRLVSRQQPAALVTTGTLIASYMGFFLLGSALAGRFVLNGNDLFFMGVPALAVFVYIRATEQKTYPAKSEPDLEDF